MFPKVSVVIVVFNGVKTIGKAISSVLQQTYSNIELIVVDGGSADGTIEVLQNMKTPCFTWISEQDKGIYDAMNKGIKMASGDWIYFLGADDELYERNIFEKIFIGTNVTGIELLYGNVKLSSSAKLYDNEFNLKKLLRKNISHQAIFYNKTVFSIVGYYNIRYRTHADWDFNIRCFSNNSIHKKYINIIIARFATGGVSSQIDIPFLRESLLPEKLKWLTANKQDLYNLRTFDEYWRFIRNACIRTENDLIELGSVIPVPGIVVSMVKWQRRIPELLLHKGLFSKMTMFLNYLFSYHKIGI